MRLSHLQIRNFRNLKKVDLDPCERFNLITGANASGKTSLLEAIYYISHLRSFRTVHLADLINHESDGLQLFARVLNNNQEIPVGIRRSQNSLEVRADRKPIRRAADISAIVPVLAIHPDSYKLLTGSPSQRRQFIDWGVFHVEHGFFDIWLRYRKALSQRNAALKSKQKIEFCTIWDKELHATAMHIDRFRDAYLLCLKPVIQNMAASFFPNQDVRIEYRRGWKSGLTLVDALQQVVERDRRQGFTSVGPHRADLLIQINGKSAQTTISRGQQKLMVAMLRLSQVLCFIRTNDQTCVLLYDDMAAELDADNRHKVLSVLEELPVQLFLTAIEREQLDLHRYQSTKMFHVEHGCVFQRD